MGSAELVALNQNQLLEASTSVSVETIETREASVRVIAFPMVAALAILASAAFAQIEANPPTPYSTGPLPEIDIGTGRTIVEPDGSWKTVKAARCGKATTKTGLEAFVQTTVDRVFREMPRAFTPYEVVRQGESFQTRWRSYPPYRHRRRARRFVREHSPWRSAGLLLGWRRKRILGPPRHKGD